MIKPLFLFIYSLSILAYAQDVKSLTYEGNYTAEDLKKVPGAPNYQDLKYWIAHPEVEDHADLVAGKGEISDNQADAEVDVFFIYPTIYHDDQNPSFPWFADVNDYELNEKIANSTIKYQATVFNGSAKIYSPLYRQAHVSVFVSDSSIREPALNLAYKDVKKAFDHYLENWNQGRPIIIAAHSQGTVHAARLLQEYFEGELLMEKLVAAYIIGMPIQKDHFAELPLCDNPNQTGCWMTWNTYIADFYPPYHKYWYTNAATVNPLSWTTNDQWVSRDQNLGGVLKNFKKIRPGVTDAKNQEGMLWIHKPRFFGNFLLKWNRYHTVDFNLFYMNIRENVALRVRNYFEKQPSVSK